MQEVGRQIELPDLLRAFSQLLERQRNCQTGALPIAMNGDKRAPVDVAKRLERGFESIGTAVGVAGCGPASQARRT